MKRIACLIVALFAMVQPATAGTLRDFEKDATKPKQSENKEKKSSTDSADKQDTESDALTQLLVLGMLTGLTAGGQHSWARVNEGYATELTGRVKPRQAGEALIPFVRLDVGYQWLKNDITAVDVRGEVGHSLVGLQVRHTRYEEKVSKDNLNITEAHGLYRMSLGNYVELDFGIGTMILAGAEIHNGFSMTTPILVHPTDWLGLEVRPVWATIADNELLDVEAAVLLGWRYASLKAGYRWFRSENQKLDGPEVGVALRW
jgi:hypothetical protein